MLWCERAKLHGAGELSSFEERFRRLLRDMHAGCDVCRVAVCTWCWNAGKEEQPEKGPSPQAPTIDIGLDIGQPLASCWPAVG
jgi:hypothetical protein